MKTTFIKIYGFHITKEVPQGIETYVIINPTGISHIIGDRAYLLDGTSATGCGLLEAFEQCEDVNIIDMSKPPV